MKRFIAVLAGTALTVVLAAGNALAQTGPYPPTTTTGVEPTSGGPGPSAFTGSDVSPAMLAVAVFLVFGLTALFVARRRAARLAA
jgi:hypothetical protein